MDCDDDCGERITRTFCVPFDSGYVFEWRKLEWKQVCANLATTGEALTSTPARLLADLRAEYRAVRRWNKRVEGW